MLHVTPQGLNAAFVTDAADNILQLACQVLSMKTILVSLLDGQKLFIKNTGPGGIVQSGIALTPPDVCHWSLVPTLHQMVVVEDTHQDAR